MSWLSYALIGAVSLAIHMLSLTKLTRLGLTPTFINGVVFFLGAMLLLMHWVLTKKGSPISVDSEKLLWIIIAAVSVYVVAHVTTMALSTAPNPGYVNAIENFSTIIVTVTSVFFLASSLNAMQFLGVVLAVIGVTLVSVFA